MENEAGTDDVVTLWRPTGRAELDLVAASQWRAWPPRLPDQPIFYPVLDPRYATKITREWNVPAYGEGFVTRFDVRRTFLDRYEVRQVGGRDIREYWIPAAELEEFNASIVGAIVEQAHYRGAVADEEFDRAAEALGRPLPDAWRAYLQSRSWFHRGWLPSGCHVRLYTPSEMLDLQGAWGESTAHHPGIAVIGGDGGREHLVLDLRRDPSPVLMVDITSEGWDSAIRQAGDVARFIEGIESGTFVFTRE